MKSAVIYSSITGNTRAVAEAVLEAMPEGTELVPVGEAPEPDGYDLLAVGFWVSKSGPDPKTAGYLKKLGGKNLILFGTMAGWPDSAYGRRVRANAVAAAGDNNVLGVFLCLGRISEKRFEAYMSGKMEKSSHPLTPERKARLVEASKHPDENDFAAARRAVAEFLRRENDQYDNQKNHKDR